MNIRNALASVAVKDVAAAKAWYEEMLQLKSSSPMNEVAEWSLPGGGGLQIYQLPERAGHGSFTLAVTDIEAAVKKLESMGVDVSQRTSNGQVKTVMITDPDANHIAFAEANDPSLVR